MARKPTDTVQLNLRFPEALRRRLERAANANYASMNAEIVHRLEQSFRREDFQKVQDAITEGMLEIMRVVDDVAKRIPVPTFKTTPGLLDLLEQQPPTDKKPGLLDLLEQQPPTDKKEDSK
jgi:hypothetical protein